MSRFTYSWRSEIWDMNQQTAFGMPGNHPALPLTPVSDCAAACVTSLGLISIEHHNIQESLIRNLILLAKTRLSCLLFSPFLLFSSHYFFSYPLFSSKKIKHLKSFWSVIQVDSQFPHYVLLFDYRRVMHVSSQPWNLSCVETVEVNVFVECYCNPLIDKIRDFSMITPILSTTINRIWHCGKISRVLAH